MKKLSLLAVGMISLFGFTGISFADESTTEKVGSSVKDTKRDVKAKAHRAEEKACEKSDKDGTCLDTKIENRATEIKDYSKDKSKEVKNKVD